MSVNEIVAKLEQALRDEIAWHKERLADLDGLVGLTATREEKMHRARLAALTAALPAPVTATVARDLTAAAVCVPGNGYREVMLAAAPSAPPPAMTADTNHCGQTPTKT